MNKTKNNVGYNGILMACKTTKSGDAKHHVEIAEKWLKNHKFVYWGHTYEEGRRYRKSKEKGGYLFIHQKGKTDILSLLKYEDICTKDMEKKIINETMFPPKWTVEKDYKNYHYFYKVTKVIWHNIPFNILENRKSEPLKKVGGMRDLAHVQIKI